MLNAILLSIVLGQTPTWAMDELTLANGATMSGLVLEESKAGVRFRVIRRPAGRPTVTLTSFFPPGEVLAIKRLGNADRKALKERLAELDATTTGERKRAGELKLVPTTIALPGANLPAFEYASERFTLRATTSEEITRRAAVRLEQIFTAYERYLPPRTDSAKPTTIYLAADSNEYDAVALHVLKVNAFVGVLPKTAFFDPAANAIVCGSDLRQLGADLYAARLHHVQQLAEVARYEASVLELYKNAPKPERDRHLKTVADERAKVYAADRRNDGQFNDATDRLFDRLYHEAFHAYIHNCVTQDLPRWLNEGLAQVFESAVLDGYELRVGHADKERLDKLQVGLKGAKEGVKLLPLQELLLSNESDYHRATAREPYYASWAVAFHLTFERSLLGTSHFDAYLAALKGGTAPRAAFEALVGKDLPAYESELKVWLARLRPDGTLRK